MIKTNYKKLIQFNRINKVISIHSNQQVNTKMEESNIIDQVDQISGEETSGNTGDTSEQTFFKDNHGNHVLNDSWVFWFHDMNDQDWSPKSYKRMTEFTTVENFWGLYNHIPSVINGMWFMMRKEHKGKPIYPLWEDPACINGGAWLFKIHKSQADNVWLDLSLRLLGETICKNSDQIIGLSISPTKHYVTIRVWNRDKKKNNTSIFPTDIPQINFDEAIYKAH